MKKILLILCMLCAPLWLHALGETDTIKAELMEESFKLFGAWKDCQNSEICNDSKQLTLDPEGKTKLAKTCQELQARCKEKQTIVKNILKLQQKLIALGVPQEEITQMSIGPALVLFFEIKNEK